MESPRLWDAGGEASIDTLIAHAINQHAATIVEEATAAVYGSAVDLRGARPLEETRRLVQELTDAYLHFLDRADANRLKEFVHHVVALRAPMSFHLSTIERGFLAVRVAIDRAVRATAVNDSDRLSATDRLGAIHNELVLSISDLFQEVVTSELRARTDELEESVRARTEELERSKVYAERLVANLAESVLVVSIDGTIKSANQAALLLLGRTAEDVVGSPIARLSDVVAAIDEPLTEIVPGVLEGREHRGVGLEISTGEGEIRQLSLGITRLTEGDDDSDLILVASDVTERARAEAELSRAQRMESVGVLAGGIAHDFNNILTAILGNISLTRNAVKAVPEVDERLAQAEVACHQATRLAQQLMTFAKGGEPVKSATSVASLLDQTVRIALSGSNTQAVRHLAEDTWDIDVDRGQFDQVLSNLFINADQAMPDGGTIDVTTANVHVMEADDTPVEPGRYVKVVVRDDGPGMAPHVAARALEPYYTTKPSGTGLGLAVAYSVMQKHGGSLAIDSVWHEGTTVTLLVPASHTTGSADEDPVEKSTATVTGSRILVMDDEPSIRTLVAAILGRYGHTVDTVPDGESAIVRYRESLEKDERYDLVVLDLTIPGGMGGKECVGELRALDPSVVAVVSSGYSGDPIMSNPEDFGFAGVVPKPYTAAGLSSAIDEVLSRTG